MPELAPPSPQAQQQPAYPQQAPAYPQQAPAYAQQAPAFAQASPGHAARVQDDPAGLQRHIALAQSRGAAVLSAEPLRANRKLEIEASVVHVLDACERLHRADKDAEQNKKRYKVLGVALLVLGIFTIWIFGLGLLFLIPAAVCWYLYRHVARADVEDRKLEVISGVLTTLGPELKACRAVKVAADFAYHDQQPPLGTHHSGAAYGHWWLTMRFVLADGSTVVVDAKTFAKVKKRRKRRYEKIKDRAHERLSVRIAPPRGKSFHPSLASRNWGRQQFSGLSLRRGVVQPRAALFEYQTAAALRTRLGGGWMGHGLEALLDSKKVVSAIIASYKLAASAERAAEARR